MKPGPSWADAWQLAEGVHYLNHGSFGPSPETVYAAAERFRRELHDNPMNFFLRRLDELLLNARESLGKMLNVSPSTLALVDNATAGMNVVASTVKLQPGDEVLLNNHEYGAVRRIWERACEQQGARVVTCDIPFPVPDASGICDTLMAAVTPRTRLIVISHITSATAAIFPVAAVCQAARERGIPVCIDGPHALLQVEVDIDAIGCDFYCASCHKWLCAPLGSGFLYVSERWQQQIVPPVLSWGISLGGADAIWQDEFNWVGTRDPAPCLAIPAAIDFFDEVGPANFRTTSHELAQYARAQIMQLTGLPPVTADAPDAYGSMACLLLPPGDCKTLQRKLWEKYRIEVLMPEWEERRLIRVSCHLYNTREQVDLLVDALRKEL